MGEMMKYIALGAMIGEQLVLILRISLFPRSSSLSFLVPQKDGGSMPCLPHFLGYLLIRKVGRFGCYRVRQSTERARIARYKMIDEKNYDPHQGKELENERQSSSKHI